MQLVQITSRWFCAGVVLDADVVIEAAPIIKYMKGWSRERVVAYCKQRGFKIVEV